MTATMADEISFGSLFEEAIEQESATTAGIAPHVEYQRDVIGWARDRLGLDERTLRWSMYGYAHHEWDGTPDPFAAVADALASYDQHGMLRSVGVESGTTTGKTFFAAVLVLWFLACHDSALVVTVAPKEDQLRLHVWKEITKLWPTFQRLFPTAKKDTLRIQMREGRDDWAAVGFVAGVRADEVEGSATKAQGFHAEHMLIVFEETPGIAPAILAAFKNTCRAPHNLRVGFGNPDHQMDALHQLCIAPGSRAIRISALDHPNIVRDNANLIPGAVSRVGLEEAKLDPGEGTPMYESRVRGISPAQAQDALIQLAWLEAAAVRFADVEQRQKAQRGPKALGVDVAQSLNGDKAAIAAGQGAVLLRVTAVPCPNATHLGRDVWATMELEGIAPDHVGVDPIGVGAATVNELADRCDEAGLGVHVRSLNAGAKPIQRTARTADGGDHDWATDANRFTNLRGQMLWQLREDLRFGRIMMARNPALFRQLTLVRFEIKNGAVVVEPKDDIKKRMGGLSPDEADAVVLWNWVRPRAKEIVPEVRTAEMLDHRSTLRVRRTLPPSHDWQTTVAWHTHNEETVEL